MNLCLAVALSLHMWIGMPGTTHIISANAPGVYLREVELTPDQPMLIRDTAYLEYHGNAPASATLTICPGYLVFLPIVGTATNGAMSYER